jgi:mono/diheme cytochrome c family protein
MHDQPRYRPLAGSQFFGDGRSARPLVQGTVARGHLRIDTRYYQGKDGQEFSTEFPMKLTRELLVRGRQRYDIYCAPCHGRTGDGEGMVVQRGFRHPPTFHQERLYNQPVGHFYDVITNGFGAMASYASRVPVDDRWAIVAYLRALQLARNATIQDVPPEARSILDSTPPRQEPRPGQTPIENTPARPPGQITPGTEGRPR